MSTGNASESLQVCTKPGCVLNVADSNHSSVLINKVLELLYIHTALLLSAHAYVNDASVTVSQQCTDLGRKLSAESDNLRTRTPINPSCDGGKSVGGISHGGDLFRSGTKQL